MITVVCHFQKHDDSRHVPTKTARAYWVVCSLRPECLVFLARCVQLSFVDQYSATTE